MSSGKAGCARTPLHTLIILRVWMWNFPPHWFLHLNTWFPDESALWRGCGGLERLGLARRGGSVQGQAFASIIRLIPVLARYLSFFPDTASSSIPSYCDGLHELKQVLLPNVASKVCDGSEKKSSQQSRNSLPKGVRRSGVCPTQPLSHLSYVVWIRFLPLYGGDNVIVERTGFCIHFLCLGSWIWAYDPCGTSCCCLYSVNKTLLLLNGGGACL